jgi:hypothetical protein
LLGPEAPLLHAAKPDSGYRNDKASYRAAIDILARGRVAGLLEPTPEQEKGFQAHRRSLPCHL